MPVLGLPQSLMGAVPPGSAPGLPGMAGPRLGAGGLAQAMASILKPPMPGRPKASGKMGHHTLKAVKAKAKAKLAAL